MVQADNTHTPIVDSSYENNVHITQINCIERAKYISDVNYTVELTLPKGDWYSGCVSVNFKMSSNLPKNDLFLDFRGYAIGNCTVNGIDASTAMPADSLFKGQHVLIPTKLLKAGESNTLKMYIANKYRKDGVGLHSFTDKTDGLQYLYTQFEADFCHFVFPCFDQPDLKACWKFSTKTESSWAIISNEAEITDAEREKSLEEASTTAQNVFASLKEHGFGSFEG